MSNGHDDVHASSTGTETSPPLMGNSPTVWIRSAVLSGIFLLMVLYTMYFTASLTMPIALGFLLSLVLSPIVRLLVRLRIHQTLAALLVTLAVAGGIVAGIYALAQPAGEWIEKAPSELRRLEYKLAWVKQPIKQVKEARDQVQEIASVEEDSGAGQGGEGQPSISLVDMAINRTPGLMYGIAVALILLFFLLASGDSLLNKMVQVTPRLEDKKRVVETAREIQRHISVYLGTITAINLVVGVVTALAMYLLDMPNPLLWGAMVAILNFIPYLGVLISMVVVGFVGLLTFDSLTQALLPPAVIFGINVIEGQIIMPIVAGRRLALSPVAIFLSIVVLGWIWGIFGVLMAVPLLASVKLLCEHVVPLNPVAIFLGR